MGSHPGITSSIQADSIGCEGIRSGILTVKKDRGSSCDQAVDSVCVCSDNVRFEQKIAMDVPRDIAFRIDSAYSPSGVISLIS